MPQISDSRAGRGLRILFVKADLRPELGGSVRAVLDLCSVAAEFGDHCDIASVGVPRDQSVVSEGSYGQKVFAASWPKRLGTSRQFARWLWRSCRQYDLVELHEVFTISACAAALVCRARRVPYVIRPHGSLDPFDLQKHRLVKALIGRLLWLTVLRSAAAFCLTSDEERDRLQTFGNSSAPRHAIPLPVRPADATGNGPRFRQQLGVSPDDVLLLFLSRIDYKKGLARLIDAVAALRDQDLQVHVALCGSGEAAFVEGIRSAVGVAGVTEQIHFTGFVDGQTKADALAASDAFVLPSDNENFGISIVEAMYAGVPVIISDRVYIARTLRAAGAATVISASAPALTHALRDFLDHRENAATIAARARAFAQANYWPAAVARLEQDMRESVLYTYDSKLKGRGA